MMLFFQKLTARLKRLAYDRNAAVAPIFAMMLIVILGISGMSIDVSMMLATRTRAQNAADAGSLAGLRIAKSYMDTNGNTTATFNAIQPTAQTNAQSFMISMTKPETAMTETQAVATLAFSNASITATTKITYSYNTSFMGLFGFDKVTESVTSTATSATAKFTQVIFMIDVSGSMGVVGKAEDMAAMVALTGAASNGAVPCAFACHQSTLAGQWDYAPVDFRAITKNAKILSKIDYAVQAVQDFTAQLKIVNDAAPGHFSTSIYTFGQQLNTVLDSTTNYDSVNSKVASIDLEMFVKCASATCAGWTGTTDAMNTLRVKIKNVGDGSSPNSMITYLILVTDGVEDIYSPGAPDNHQTDTAWSSACSAIKIMGVNLATVQAQYPPITMGNGTGAYDALVGPIASQVAPAMTSCASSSDLALSASDGPGLQTAIGSLFAKVSASPRLSN